MFVMEEEYRAHKRGETVDLGKAAQAAAARAGEQDAESDNASTRGVREGSEPPTTAKTDIPTIRISTESARTPVSGATPDGELPKEEREAAEVEKPQAAHGVAEDKAESASATAAETGGVPAATTADTGATGNGEALANGHVNGDQAISAFSNKRLCERWLDNLFLVLYEVSSVRVPLEWYELVS